MADIGEAMFARYLAGPFLHGRTLNLLGSSAGSAHQVVVVRRAAPSEDHLAVFSANAIEFSSDCHGLQGSIHSREAHAFTGRPEIGVDLLR